MTIKWKTSDILQNIKKAAQDAANSIDGDDAPARREAFRDTVYQELQEYGITFGNAINRDKGDIAEEMILQLFGYYDPPLFLLHPVIHYQGPDGALCGSTRGEMSTDSKQVNCVDCDTAAHRE